MLGSSGALPEVPNVDEYWSIKCEHLRTLDAQTTVIKSPLKKLAPQGVSEDKTTGGKMTSHPSVDRVGQ